jgi:hypothetical protein
MKTIEPRAIRDGRNIRWLVPMVPGLEQWGEVVCDGTKVRIDGKEVGLIAMDWLRDRGYEPVIAKR